MEDFDARRDFADFLNRLASGESVSVVTTAGKTFEGEPQEMRVFRHGDGLLGAVTLMADSVQVIVPIQDVLRVQ